jgi:hypothetical protein
LLSIVHPEGIDDIAIVWAFKLGAALAATSDVELAIRIAAHAVATRTR